MRDRFEEALLAIFGHTNPEPYQCINLDEVRVSEHAKFPAYFSAAPDDGIRKWRITTGERDTFQVSLILESVADGSFGLPIVVHENQDQSQIPGHF